MLFRSAKPAIILADEPTGNLDSRTSLDVLGLLKVTGEKFKQTIIMITHNEEIAQMADRIIRIEDGRIAGGSAEAGKNADSRYADERIAAGTAAKSGFAGGKPESGRIAGDRRV